MSVTKIEEWAGDRNGGIRNKSLRYDQNRNEFPRYEQNRNESPRYYDQNRNESPSYYDQNRNESPSYDQNRNESPRYDQNRNESPRYEQNRNESPRYYDQNRNESPRFDQNRNEKHLRQPQPIQLTDEQLTIIKQLSKIIPDVDISEHDIYVNTLFDELDTNNCDQDCVRRSIYCPKCNWSYNQNNIGNNCKHGTNLVNYCPEC
jgi:hypothetical protein